MAGSLTPGPESPASLLTATDDDGSSLAELRAFSGGRNLSPRSPRRS